jgi:hypothetical protein
MKHSTWNIRRRTANVTSPNVSVPQRSGPGDNTAGPTHRSNSHYRSKTCHHPRWPLQYALTRYGNPVMTDRFASEIVAVRLHPT